MNECIYKELGVGRSIFYGWDGAMHTRVDLILCHRPQSDCEEAARRIAQELKRLEFRLSKFDPSSDLARINAQAADHPVEVDDELWEILLSALRYGAATGFHFDPTYASKKGSPGNRVYLDPDRRAVLFKTRGTELDLGGFGKGYGLQKAQEMLLADGWTDFLLNFGNSSVCARGDRPGGTGWCVGVENQLHLGSNALEVVLRDRSLNTSGNTGRHTRHIWSAEKGGYIDGLRSVSVLTESPLEGEILSTALFAALDGFPDRLPDFVGGFPGINVYGLRYDGGVPTVKAW